MKFLFHMHYTPLFIFNKSMWYCNYFQGGFGFFSKVALVASIVPSLEIPICSWISTWSMRISWPHVRPKILPSLVASQVRKKFHNRFFLGVIHLRLNMFSKPAHLAHLNSLASIFIHCNIFWLSFTLDIGFFWTSFSTCFSTCTLPLHFIIVFIPNLERWGIILEIGLSSNNYWKNTSPLLTSCYNSSSSTSLDARIGCGYS